MMRSCDTQNSRGSPHRRTQRSDREPIAATTIFGSLPGTLIGSCAGISPVCYCNTNAYACFADRAAIEIHEDHAADSYVQVCEFRRLDRNRVGRKGRKLSELDK